MRLPAIFVLAVVFVGCSAETAPGPAVDAALSDDGTFPASDTAVTDSGGATTCRVLDGNAPPCPTLDAGVPLAKCAATCPAGLSPGDECAIRDTTLGNQFCVCQKSGGFSCSNSQPMCPTSRDGACPFAGAQCDFCENGELVTYICGRGTWTLSDVQRCH
jgi:hypothetical protein